MNLKPIVRSVVQNAHKNLNQKHGVMLIGKKSTETVNSINRVRGFTQTSK